MQKLLALITPVLLFLITMFIFFIGTKPYFWSKTADFWSETPLKVASYYATLFFAVLFGASILLLLRTIPYQNSGDQKRLEDHRVVHFTLRLALIFGTGAVIVATLMMAALFGRFFIR